MTVAPVSSPVGLAREAIAFYQFIDPLRGKVEQELRVDLDKTRKHNGQITFVTMPPAWYMPNPEFREFNTETEFHQQFHQWIQNDLSIWTLAFSENTASALMHLVDLSDNTVTDLAIELYPSEQNEFLGRAHGRPGTYTGGCRGPLCRAANTLAQRSRYMGKTPELDRQKYEAALMQVRDSYEAYLAYIKGTREFRRSIRSGGEHIRLWMHLNVRDTILIDCTDESYLLDPT